MKRPSRRSSTNLTGGINLKQGYGMKITRVIDREFKTGKTNGKPWTMVKVEVEGGKEATGFGTVVEGDEVDLTYNDTYHNYSFKLLKQGEIPSKDINEDMQDSGSGGATQIPSP